MAIGRRFVDNVPNLIRPWNDSRRELMEYLRKQRDSTNNSIPSGFLGNTPVTVLVGGTADPGNQSSGWMAADAQLVIDSDTPLGLANANTEGTDSGAARADHQHKRDVRIAFDGADIGTRNRINFTSTGVTVTDDAGNDEVDVPIATPGIVQDSSTLAYYLAQVF